MRLNSKRPNLVACFGVNFGFPSGAAGKNVHVHVHVHVHVRGLGVRIVLQSTSVFHSRDRVNAVI